MDSQSSDDLGSTALAHWLAAYSARAADLKLPSDTDIVLHDLSVNRTTALRGLLDAEVTGLRIVMSKILHTRNRLSTCDSLPSEILEHIFMDLAGQSPMSLGSKDGPVALGWVNVTHVSRRWRNTAINYAALWSTIAFDISQPWPVFLERSKDAPLTIIDGSGRSPNAKHVDELSAHSQRIRVLSLGRTKLSSQCIAALGRMLHKPHLALHTILIEAGGHSSSFDDILPPDLMSRVIPNVVHLDLRSMGLPLGANANSLQSLQLSHSHKSRPTAYTIEDLLDTLRHSPSLQLLSLGYMMPAPDDEAHDLHANHVSLPHLKVLSLQDQGRLCTIIWSLLDVPATTEVLIKEQPGYELSTVHDILAPFSTHSHRYLNQPTPPDLQLDIDVYVRTTTTLRLICPGKRQRSIPTAGTTRTYTPMRLSVLTPSFKRQDHDVLCVSLPAAIPTELIKEIRFNSQYHGAWPSFTPRGIRSMLSGMKALSTLELKGPFAGYVLLALSGDDEQAPVAPTLKHLRVDAVWFYEEVLPGRAGSFLELLDHTLDTRYARHGLALESLSVRSCNERAEPATKVEHLKDPGRWGGRTRVSTYEMVEPFSD
ncbi:unnamed protein product [Peniophora sp. CBMAI 1063]|nr:unnamed protein product [Peniophora sp. CBMAI 1063]